MSLKTKLIIAAPLKSLSVFLLLQLLIFARVFSQCQQLVWSDEFDGTSLDLSKWSYQTGNGTNDGLSSGWGNNELEYYTSRTQNVTVRNGNLEITALAESYLGSSYTSGRIRSSNPVTGYPKNEWKYGSIEASIKVPAPYQDSGHWPGFWMLSHDSPWPNTGEIDIMETGLDYNEWTYNGTLHYWSGAHQQSGTGPVTINTSPPCAGPNGDLSTCYHTYRADWAPGTIKFFVDGVQVGSTMSSGNTVGGAWPFDGSNFYIILNMAVGGWFPGNPTNSSRYPLTMYVDYVRVYSNPSSTQITGKTKVMQGDKGVIYSVSVDPSSSLSWSVPSGATIVSGQGTSSITVDYGSSAASGNVSVTVTPSGSGCATVSANLPVSVLSNTCTLTLEDFETGSTPTRNLGFNFSTGWMNRSCTTCQAYPYGTYANPSASGVNTTPNVGKYERNAGVQYDVIAYNDIAVGDASNFRNGITTFQMDVYSTAPSGTQVMVQLENRDNAQTGWPNGIYARFTATTGASNTWNTLKFTLLDTPDAGMSAIDVDQLVLFFNPNSYTNHTYYFDNFKRIGVTPSTSAITGNASVCQNSSGNKYSVTGLTGSTYTWTVPSGATITSGQGTNTIYVNFGTSGGNVSVTEKSSVNCTGTTKNLAITMGGSCALVADFSATPLSTCVGNTIVFTDQTTGKTGGETFSWNFGSGASPATASGAGPISVKYTTGGTKTVSLTVSNSGSSNTNTKTSYITIANPPTTCLFSDDYNNSTVNWIAPVPGAFTHTESGTAWTISNTGYSEWENFTYTLNDGSSSAPLDFSCAANAPVLKIKAKASANCFIRVALMDGNGRTTDNMSTYNLELTTSYQTFTINYSGNFRNYYGASPGVMDSSNIAKLQFFVNPGYVSYPYTGTNGTYNAYFPGTVDIDWIGIGNSCNAPSTLPTISGFTPACVSAGSSVTITGTNLSSATGVSFNGKAGTITSNTSTQIIATVPSGVTAGNISVTTSAGSVTSSIGYTVAVTPSVSIALTSGSNPGCSGTSLTFTATPTNGGTTPSYQWKVNGANTGTNSSTFTSSTLANNDVVSCVMTSNASCVTSSTATSGNITVTRTANVTPSVSIALTSGSNPSCSGTSLTFTATPTNGGTTPSYQWKVNGTNTGTNSSTFISSTLANNDIVSCVMTSNASCVTSSTATSGNITVTRTANVTPSVSIALTSGSNPSCSGTSLTFTATPTNGGITPSYQWKVNGTNTGTNSSTFTSSTLANNDVVSCVMTSNASCVTSSTATSGNITVTRTANVTPSVSIALTSGSNPSCSGTSLTFAATPTNGGTTPSYQWKVNGTNTGTNSTTFSSSTLANNDVVSCVMTSNVSCATSSTATSGNITVTKTSNVTPSVSIALTSGSNPSCSGTSLTFTATPTNGGTTPSYQWKVNGTNTGTNSTAFSSSTLVNNDVVSCVMTSNASCATSSTATSGNITVTKTSNVTPSVSIALTSGSNPSCSGTSLTFTATPTNGGTTPSYQWKVNGTNSGTNSSTFTSSTLVNNDVVSCVMTSNASCVTSSTATSGNITLTRNANVTPSVTIVANGGSTICSGTSVNFNASPTNGGASPTYQWKVNGVNSGTNSSSFTIGSLSNNDVVSCVMTSNASCLTTSSATSNNITMTVSSNVTPTVSISSSAGNTICSGSSVTFTASPNGGGSNPSYQWMVNGTNVGTNSSSYVTSSLSNGQVVSCTMTSNSSCATTSTATSNSITMTVTSKVTPSVSIALTTGSNPSCSATSLTFAATPTNGGTTPSYQWKVNGINSGTNSATFTSSTLANNDVVSCLMTSNASCITSSTATSGNITVVRISNVTPSVAISLTSGSNPSCSGTALTFTATPTNGGTTPSYQWKVNGSNVGTNNATFASSTFANNDVVSCVMTSNASCASITTATSNSVTINVSSAVTPAVSIAITSGNNPSCSGNSVTFTATPTNGGSTPSYQWKINGINVGSNSSTYTSSTLANGNSVSCVMTSSSSCASQPTATSNSVTMSVNAQVVPSVSIAITSGNNPSCSGSSVTFTATPTNGGSTPSYQWRINGINVGSNSSTYTSSTLANGNSVSCIMTSSSSCASQPTATSNSVTMSVNAQVVPSVSITITSGSNPTCSGNTVTFTATPVNGGSSPSYQWKLNGVNAGTNSSSYSSASFIDGDVISCSMTSNATCVSVSSASSNYVTMKVNPVVTPSISIAVTTGSNPGCAGNLIGFTATPTNGGSNPSYQWQVNGNNVGINNHSYASSGLSNGDVISCILTSDVTCASSASATSNTVIYNSSPVVVPDVSIAITSGTNPTCEGNVVVFKATPVNGGSSPIYQWKLNGTDAGNTHTYSFSGNNNDQISVVMTSTVSCASPTSAISGTVTMGVDSSPSSANAGPDQNIFSNSVNLAANTPSVGSGVWTQISGSGNIVNANDPFTEVTGLSAGDNIFRWTITNGSCAESADEVIINVTPSAVLSSNSSNMTVYPNPFTNETLIKINSGSSERVRISIKDTKGIILQEMEKYTNEEIWIGEYLPAGIYVVQTVYNNTISIFKLIKSE